MCLVPNLPSAWFPKLDNIKLYVGWLHKPLFDILDMEKFQQLPVNIVDNKIPDTNRITFVRHLESKYNEYKETIKNDSHYQEFMTTKSIKRKNELVEVLMKDFFTKVGIDYKTWLSDTWHQEWNRLSYLYAELIQNNPELFPDLIYISPYVRTRLTAHYFLQNIKWLDIDFEKLINQSKLKDLIIWSFLGKDITIKIDERIRERDHGSNIAPSFIRDYLDGKNNFHNMLTKEEREMMYYYTSPAWWESQAYTNARKHEFLKSVYEKNKFKNIWCFDHHLDILWGVQSISGWSFETFYKLNEMRRPKNGSLTVFSKVPKTQKGDENKFRIAGYNLSLEE